MVIQDDLASSLSERLISVANKSSLKFLKEDWADLVARIPLDCP